MFFDIPYRTLTNQIADPNFVNALSIYTDVSKRKKGGRRKINSRSLCPKLQWTRDSQISSFHAEFIRVTITANALSNRNITSWNVYIVIDCRQALLTLVARRITSRLIQERRQWIKGHGNSEGNRIADRFVKKTARYTGLNLSNNLILPGTTDLTKEQSHLKFVGG